MHSKRRIFNHPQSAFARCHGQAIAAEILFAVFALYFSGCNKRHPQASTIPANPTIASMVPAATDLLVGMGARDQLVAVSTFDRNRQDVGQLPKAGDYQTVDWELLRSLHPTVLISQIAPERQNSGFKANLSELSITSLNVTIENLNDIFSAIDSLGAAIHRPQLAQIAEQKMRSELEVIHQRVSQFKPVNTLLVIDSSADAVVGPGTYLDDLLKIAGGTNSAAALTQHWPQIDREMLLSLKPEVIIQLLPGASPQVRAQGAATWKQMPLIPAVAHQRVYPIYDEYALLPGWHVTNLARQFAHCLHPEATN